MKIGPIHESDESPAPNEVFLSFDTPEEAELFREFVETAGYDAWERWAERH